MIDEDGIERPDDPHEHMVHNKIEPTDQEIDADYNYINKNIFFRIWSAFFCMLVWLIMGLWIKFRYKLKIEGKKNIKLVKKTGVVVTVNHVHNFDSILVGTKILNKRKCYFITLKDNINMPFVGGLLRSLGGLPIPTTVKGMPSFEKSVEGLLKDKKALIVCPEASLWPYYRGIRPFKKGAFRFAVSSNVPVLPVVISFRRKLKRKAKKGKVKSQKPQKMYRHYFTVHVGEPIYPDKTLHKNECIKDLLNRTQQYYQRTIEEVYKDEKSYSNEAPKAQKSSKKKTKLSEKD